MLSVSWCHNLDADHCAEMRTSSGLDAEMVLAADHLDHQTWLELRKSVLHELIHLWTDGMHDAQRALVENLVPTGAMQNVVNDHFDKAHEKAVDGFLAVVLDVPGWEDKDLADAFQAAQSEPQEAPDGA